jgi:hypothetical protein
MRLIVVGLPGFLMLLAGCASQIHSTAQHHTISLNAGDLEAHGVAFITPSTVTGQEEEKQAVAFTVAETLMRLRPQLRCVTLSKALGAINRAGLADDYRRMYADYRDTGLFRQELLQRIGAATDSRYLIQLKLAGFKQESSIRFGMLGLRLIETKSADVRLFFQVWDSREGAIAWEGVAELNYSSEAFAEKPVTLRVALEKATEDLAARLP